MFDPKQSQRHGLPFPKSPKLVSGGARTRNFNLCHQSPLFEVEITCLMSDARFLPDIQMPQVPN